jgi:CheY-like chemotaxis protein
MNAIPPISTLLIIDDSQVNLALLSNLLKDKYKVKVAINGEKGLKLANSTPLPDLILLDIMMPIMDGFEVCEQLKQNMLTRSIPVIFLSGKSETEDETKCRQLGAVDYMIKPIDIHALLASIGRQLKVAEHPRHH